MRFIDDEPYIEYEIAHIRDANPGNRFDSTMTDDDRRDFRNLVLLCGPHHELVDIRHPERFDVATLEGWKRDREADGFEALVQIGPTDERELRSAMEDAAINVENSILHVGGTGGSAPGAGGGGGGSVGGGVGGDGGRGGNIIDLGGRPGTAPGAGGGGAGSSVPGGYGAEGGGGGETVSGFIELDDAGVTFEAIVGQGGENGRDGEPTAFVVRDADGNVLHRIEASGGPHGRSGAELQALAEGPGIAISSAVLVRMAEITGGLFSAFGAGWCVLPIASTTPIDLAFVVTIDALAIGHRETHLRMKLIDDSGAVRAELEDILQLAAQGLPARESRCYVFRDQMLEPGQWEIQIESGDQGLATIDFRVELLSA